MNERQKEFRLVGPGLTAGQKLLRKSLRYISPVKNPFGNPFDYRFRVKYPFKNQKSKILLKFLLTT